MKKWILLLPCCLLVGCLREAADPFTLSPTASFANWTPMKGNTLISSKYCKTILPDTFGSKELSLAELLDIALQNNPSTQKTWAMARAAAAQYGQALSPFMPDIEFNGSYVREKGTFIQLDTEFDYFTTQTGPDVTLTYTLFDFGQRTAAARAAKEALYYADFNHNQEIQNVLQAVMEDYYKYLYEQAALKAKQADLLTAQMSLDAANEKFSLGLAALGDVAQARTQYLQSKINLTTQKQNVEDAFAQLAFDLGLPANLLFKVQYLPDQVVADPLLASVEELVKDAQKQRQDFLALQADLRSKEALLLQAKRAPLPVLQSSLDAGHYWYEKGIQENEIHWSLQFNLTFPIFDGFRYKNEIKKAEANLNASKAVLLQKELSLFQSVTTSHMAVKTAAENLNDSAEYLKAAELEFKIAFTSYKSGTATILDVISAQSSLADARSKKANSQKDWFISLTALSFATGSLCSCPEEAPCTN